MLSTAACHFCTHEFFVDPDRRRSLPRVTSDCRPGPRTGALVVCPSCCLAQTVVSGEWRNSASDAYRDYAIYEAAGGAEQKVTAGGGLESRSQVLVGELARLRQLPSSGRLLDVGCGNGGFLRAFAEHFPGWELDGAETSDRDAHELAVIPGFRRLYGTDHRDLPADYDAISLIHVLEHIEAPAPFLSSLREKLSPEGLLLVEVPSWKSNPFALMISDHASHFTSATLAMVVRAAGWKTEGATDRWVTKELSLLARNVSGDPADFAPTDFAVEDEALQAAVRWLTGAMEQAQTIASASVSFGLFGSAIAASWLYQGVGDRVRFFVDEDRQRVGRTHLGLPILSPAQVPAGSDVFVGISPVLSDVLARRLSSDRCRYHAVRGEPLPGIAVPVDALA